MNLQPQQMRPLDRARQYFTPEVEAHIYFDIHIEEEARSKSGSYYTPLVVVAQMVEDAFLTLLEHRIGLSLQGAKLFLSGAMDPRAQVLKGEPTPSEIMEALARLNWLDMAAGTGVFALFYLQVIKALCEDYALGESWLDLCGSHMYINDVNAEALKRFEALSPVPTHILHRDALTELYQDAGVKSVLAAGGFDLIIGNPPYLGERGNKAIFDQYRTHPNLQEYYVGKMDLFYFFLHQGMEWLSDQGCLCQITTHYFTTADGAWKLRQALKDHMALTYLRYASGALGFSDVKQLSFLSLTGIKTSNKGIDAQIQVIEGSQCSTSTRLQKRLYDDKGQLSISTLMVTDILQAALDSTFFRPLEMWMDVNQGVVTGMDRSKDKPSKPVFVFEEDELPEYFDHVLFKPFVKNSMIKAFTTRQDRPMWLMYTDGTAIIHYPQALAHLTTYKDKLSQRREILSGQKPWYALQWGRDAQRFERPKIIVPQRAYKNQFAYVAEPLYGSADVYYIGHDHASETLLKGLCTYLNSPFVYAWLMQYGKRKGLLLELYATPLKAIPVPQVPESMWEDLRVFYDQIEEQLANASCEAHLTPGFLEMHKSICKALQMSPESAKTLWDWYNVSIQSQ